MPRSKYAKLNKVDKLHRQQKADLRQEHLDSHLRASTMLPTSTTTSTLSDSVLASSQDPTATTNPQTLSSSDTPVVQSPLWSPPPTPDLSYTLLRTLPSKSLPIYESSKSGGTKHITTIRKLDGNLHAMRSHLLEALGLQQYELDRRGRKKDNIAINWRTKHLVVRGWRGPEVKKWAEMVGF